MKKLKTNITLWRYILHLIKLIIRNPKSYKYKVNHSLDFEGKGYFMTINGTKEASLIIPCENKTLKYSDEILVKLKYITQLLKTHPLFKEDGGNDDLNTLISSAERTINKTKAK